VAVPHPQALAVLAAAAPSDHFLQLYWHYHETRNFIQYDWLAIISRQLLLYYILQSFQLLELSYLPILPSIRLRLLLLFLIIMAYLWGWKRDLFRLFIWEIAFYMTLDSQLKV
jgi:hypothetical protein